MTKEEYKDSRGKFEKIHANPGGEEKYILRLYVTGLTTKSTTAIESIKRICEEYLKGRYELEVIDIYQQPGRAREAEVIAIPTLIKQLPLPLRKLIGDMSNEERVIVELDLHKKK